MRSQSVSERIFAHADRLIAPFSSETGATWAAVPTGMSTHEAWPLASVQFRDWLAHSFFSEHGVFPGRSALNHAVRLIQARARFHPTQTREDVFARIGYRGRPQRPEALIIDLANPQREVVEITARGWRITTEEAHRFRPILAARPLPHPSTARCLEPLNKQLADFLPLRPADLNRIAVWLLAALRPAGPYPILILTGPPASGKSTAARILRCLVDPHVAPLQTAPASERELFRHALHNRVLAFDHVRSLKHGPATALTRVAAGASFTLSSNHPYDDPLPFHVERPVIITVPYSETSAANWNSYRTIQSLAITVHFAALAPENMRSQRVIEDELEQAAPAVFATLCNAASAALADVENAPAPVSRFTDLQQWIAAALPILGLSESEANAAMTRSPLVTALLNLLAEEHEWTGTVTELVARIGYEGTPKALTQQLISLPLAIFGIRYESSRSTAQRTIRLSMTDSQKNLSLACGTSVME